MKVLPRDEIALEQTLQEYGLPSAPEESGLGELVSLAAQICQATHAGVAILAPDAVHYISRFGEGPARVPRGRVPCEAALHAERVYEITDVRNHPDFGPEGLSPGGPPFRFYAGAPLITPDGVRIGTLFVQAATPKTLTEAQQNSLVVLARQVMARLELTARVRQVEDAAEVRGRLENALTVERNFVSTVLDTIGALVAVFDTAGRIVRFNRSCELVSGYDSAAMVGHYLWEKLIPPEDVPEAVATFGNLRAGHLPAQFENRWLHRDGSLHRIAWSATSLSDPQGDTAFLIITGMDVTFQRAAEATLRESEARYRQLIEGSLGLVFTHDAAGILLSVNALGAESIGYTVAEMEGRNLLDFVSENRLPSFDLYLREVAETGAAQGRFFLRHRLGHERVFAFRNRVVAAPSCTSPTPSWKVSAKASTALTGKVASRSSTPPPPRCLATARKSSSAATSIT